MSARLEAFLAELYVDAESRRRFLEDPRAASLLAGLSDADVEALARIDRAGLALAARSFATKREHTRPRRSTFSGRLTRARWWRYLWAFKTAKR